MSTSAMRAIGIGPFPGLLVAAGLAAFASACTTSPTPDQMARTTLETAPADLQLLCANEAARSAGVEAGKVLPVSSRKLDAKNYQVELNAGGKPTTCLIDADGRIVSIQPT
ncbi:hypothetical protein [Mesorhizobium sp. IMUNJ 23232]|uniref:hypothetical protein n=1 Tax=Mesorhizobium sp. IMUNJ 23232 TaxID=3376064 RepID=UPI0037B18234